MVEVSIFEIALSYFMSVIFAFVVGFLLCMAGGVRWCLITYAVGQIVAKVRATRADE